MQPLDGSQYASIRKTAMAVVKRDQQTGQMSQSATDDKQMKDLMRTTHQVKAAGKDPFRNAGGIDGGAQDVQEALEKHPTQTDLAHHPIRAIQHQTVRDGEDGRRTHPDEHAGPEGPPFGGLEAPDRRDADASDADRADHVPVHPLQGREAVEPIVDAGDEAAHDETHDTDVVQTVPDPGNRRAMIRDGVVRRRHAQTEGRADEEAGKHVNVCLGRSVHVSRSENPVQVIGDGERKSTGQEMAVYVDGLVVEVGKGEEGAPE